MLHITWVAAGAIAGMLVATIIIPPNRKVPSLPAPNDPGLFHTTMGCVKFDAQEVPCGGEPDSLNLLAAKK